MKKINQKIALASFLAALFLLSGCDHGVAISSTVHDDGSLDRTIVLYDADSADVSHNFLGVSEAGGWHSSIEVDPASSRNTEGNKDKEITISFSRHFLSVADANAAMNPASDTVFRMMSTFERKDRWFYTYIDYSDTYRALDRFRGVPREDYFTKEDYAFIDRLPAEGKPISKADSIYLARLNEKIFDIYGARTIFEELFTGMLATLREYKVAPQWSDSLIAKKEKIYQHFQKDESMEKDGLISIADYLKIPLPNAARADLRKQYADMEPRLNVISEAYTGKFLHTIRMPWTVVSTNADSVNGSQLVWNPPVIKFMLKDYTMTARARQMNLWAVAVSAVIVVATVTLFFVRRRVTTDHVS